MTQKEKLIDLLDEESFSAFEKYETPISEVIADFLLEHGVCVFNDSAIDRSNLPLTSTMADIPINDVLDLLKAEKEGRLVKLPCNPGDRVYVIGRNIKGEQDIQGFYVHHISFYAFGCVLHGFLPQIFARADDIGKTAFSEYEEAEDALERIGKDVETRQ